VAVLRFQNYEDLADVVTRHMQQLPAITSTHTLMAFKCYSRDDLQQAWDIGIE
jgi:DNA-binding Lrp family transcriptional regulator